MVKQYFNSPKKVVVVEKKRIKNISIKMFHIVLKYISDIQNWKRKFHI